MAALNLISAEILDAIIEQLSKRDLASLAQSCTAFPLRVQPVLYRSISWTWSGKRSPVDNPPIHLLIRSTLQNPELSSSIQYLDFLATDYRVIHHTPFGPGNGPQLASQELAKALNFVSELPQAEDWCTALRNGHIGASIALLLLQLPELRFLGLGPDLQKDNVFLSIALNHMIGRSPQASRLEYLESVNLGGQLTGNDHRHYSLELPLDHFLPFFYLPNLKSAEMLLPDLYDRPNRSTYPRQQRIPWPLPAASAPALTSLRLKRSRASPEMLKDITAVTPQLKLLEYDYWCRSFSTLNTESLRAALKNVCSTLEYLQVAFTPYSGEAEDVGDQGERVIRGALGSLIGFASLKSLEISLTVLLGWHVKTSKKLCETLPAGLRSVTFRDDCYDFEEWEWWDKESMAKFLDFVNGNWKNAVPHLMSLNLELLQADLNDWEEPVRQQLISACEAQGLECKIVKLGRDAVNNFPE